MNLWKNFLPEIAGHWYVESITDETKAIVACNTEWLGGMFHDTIAVWVLFRIFI